MADRGSDPPASLPLFLSTPSQGLTLAQLSGPLNFGPTLVPLSTDPPAPDPPQDVPFLREASLESDEESSFVGQSPGPAPPPQLRPVFASPEPTPQPSTYQSPVAQPAPPLDSFYTPPNQFQVSYQHPPAEMQTSPNSTPYTPSQFSPQGEQQLSNESMYTPQTTPAFEPTQTPQPQFYNPVNAQTSISALQPRLQLDPVKPHWFYYKNNRIWTPFSHFDSGNLEHAFKFPPSEGENIIHTEGGRYDVNLSSCTRHAVYWDEEPSVVRRCTWFYRGDGENKLVPYAPDVSEKLEKEFIRACTENLWPCKVELAEGNTVMMHNLNVMVHFKPVSEPLEWSGEDSISRPRVVRRGVTDIEEEIMEGEPTQIDHLVFVVHGIGPVADLRFRDLVECVNDLRSVALNMLDSHRHNISSGKNPEGRVEFLPIKWHSQLHHDSDGVDRMLKPITLQSITRLREFTNNTLLDILFYTSPTYCQTIFSTVGSEINRLFKLFKERNPSYSGEVSVCGHSLGSSILFDVLTHQTDDSKPQSSPSSPVKEAPKQQENKEDDVRGPVTVAPAEQSQQTLVPDEDDDDDDELDEDIALPTVDDVLTRVGLQDFIPAFHEEQIDLDALMMCSDADLKEMKIPMGPRKKLMGHLKKFDQVAEAKKKQDERRARKKLKAQLREQLMKEFKDLNITETPSSTDTKDQSAQCDSIDAFVSAVSSIPKVSSSVESVEVTFQRGPAGTGQPSVNYPQLAFKPAKFFALGSPIGLFLTIRGIDNIGLDFQLPTCPKVYNIFHPYDPVAYRIEPLVDPTFSADPVLLPHHKGRKRMHLELRENLTRIGTNLKETLIQSVRSTWASIHDFARAHTVDVDVMGEGEMDKVHDDTDSVGTDISEQETLADQIPIGKLNGGGRIDYVLQEKPIEVLNEYLFAVSSHLCYWESEDTALFMLREIYRKNF